MSGGTLHLTEAIRAAIVALRQVADSLESALGLGQHGPARSPVLRTSEPTEWDVISQAESSGQPSENRGYQEVAQLLSRVPPYCLDLCSRLGRDREERAQRAWEAGLWAKAVLEGKVAKPRPTVKLDIQPTVYVVLRGPGITQPVVAFSAADYYKLVPRFTEGSLSHSFPSKSEAKIYILAAGARVPPEL
jgi:hypothetical protein